MEIEFTVNVAYHLFICPFRFRHGKECVELVHTRRRKVACMTLLTLFFIVYTGTQLYPNLRAVLKEHDPGLILSIAIISTEMGFIISALHILWFRRTDMQKLLECLCEDGTGEIQRFGPRWIKLAILAPIVLPIMFCLYPPLGVMESFVTEVLGCPNTSFPQSSNVPVMGWVDAFSWYHEDCSMVAARIFFVIQIFVLFGYNNLWGLAHSMLITSSISIYRMADNLHSLLSTNEFRYTLIHHYNKTKIKIGLLNKIFSVSTLIATVTFVFQVSYSVPVFLMDVGISMIVLIPLFLLILGVLLVASEANRLVTEVEKSIISMSPQDAANTALIIASTTGDCGLKGFHFFTISYTFVGSICTLIFTFMLVVFQIPRP